MSEQDTVDNIQAAVAEANELNALSQPLGYAVTCQAGGGLGDEPTHRRFTVHRIDHPLADGPSFDTVDEVRQHLHQIANLPRWWLDLDDDSISFDTAKLTITDKRTGESFCLKGWKSFGIGGLTSGDKASSVPAGVHHISVAAAEPPSIGRWYQAADDPRPAGRSG